MTKYSTVPLMATGIYEFLEILTVSSIAVVSYNFFLIIALFFLLSYRVFISYTLSKILPVDSDNKVSILSWASFSNFLPSEIDTTT
jgi:hypothetical protein